MIADLVPAIPAEKRVKCACGKALEGALI
jgi:hypothetical protein